MSIVNFSVTKPLEQKINKTIHDFGFSTKAEFFRFAVIYFINEQINKKTVTEEEKFDYLTSELAKVAHKKLIGKKLPSLREQLSNV